MHMRKRRHLGMPDHAALLSNGCWDTMHNMYFVLEILVIAKRCAVLLMTLLM